MKAANEHIGRRTLIKAITATTAAVALAAVPAAAAHPADPVFAAIAERARLEKLAHEASDRHDAVVRSLPREAFGYPVLTSAIAKEIGLPIHCARHDRIGDGPTPGTGLYIWRVEPGTIERFNASTEAIVSKFPGVFSDPAKEAKVRAALAPELARRKAEGAKRLAWWRKERRRQTAIKVRAGFYRTNREMSEAWEAFARAENVVAETAATTLAGVAAKLRLLKRLFDEGSSDNDLVIGVLADVERLLANGTA